MEFESDHARLFYEALRIRRVEQRIIDLYPSDKIQSPVHLSIGQESVSVGLAASRHDLEPVFATYRAHAIYLALGGDLGQFFAELYGKNAGCGSGKAGSMHLAAPEVGLMGSSAVVASTLPHALGYSLAKRLKGEQAVSIAIFGDGAMEEGVYHECLNFAALHRLPVLLVCENNGLAVHASQEERQSFSMASHVQSYGLPYYQFDKTFDLLACRDFFKNHLDAVWEEQTPRVLEVRTARYKEHVGPGEDFNAGYRAIEELEPWWSKDCLRLDTALLNKYSATIEQEIDEAVHFAERSALPEAEELLSDVI